MKIEHLKREPTESPIYEMAGHYIRRLHQISLGAFAKRTLDVNIKLTQVQFAALSVITVNPGIDQTALSQNIAYDRATIGGVIDRLEKNKLVRRTPVQTDRRINGLFVTDLGTETYEQVVSAAWLVQEDIMQGLNKTEQRELIRLLIKATEASNKLSRAPMKRSTHDARLAIKTERIIDES